MTSFETGNTITLADVLIHLRRQLIEALDQHDETSLAGIESALNAIRVTVFALHSAQGNRLLQPVDEMLSAIGDYFHGSTAKSSLPDEAEIRAVFQTHAGERTSSDWREAHIEGKVTRDAFIDALKSAILNTTLLFAVRDPEKLGVNLLALITEQLQVELTQQKLSENAPEPLLNYANLAEKLVMDKVEQTETVQFKTAQEIIQALVNTIH